jgi:hypothetical protein
MCVSNELGSGAAARDAGVARIRNLTRGAVVCAALLSGAFAGLAAASTHVRTTPARMLPELIQLDDWVYPIVDGRPVPKELLSHARRAVDACPTLALALARAERAAESIAAVDGAEGGARGSSKRGAKATR